MNYYKKFESTAKFWLSEIEKYNEEPFFDQSKEVGFSVAQVYHYFIEGTIQFHIQQIHACINQTNGQLGGGKTFLGSLVFFYGGYLPFVTRKSKSISKSEKYDSITITQNKLIKLMKLVHEASQKVEKLSPEQLRYRVKHPYFGMLNANEWLEVLDMRAKYLIKEKYKADKLLIK